MAPRRGARTAAQHPLVGHELAVVLAERAVGRAIARIRDVGTPGPLPDVAEPPGRRCDARVEACLLDEVPLDRRSCGGALPFVLARQACTGPARERVGFVEGDVADGLVVAQRLEPPQREHGRCRAGLALPPVERSAPALALERRPAVREPELRPLVATVGDEGAPLGVRDRPCGDLERLEQHPMTGPLVVECEARPGRPDLDDLLVERQPGRRPGRARLVVGRRRAIGGCVRGERERVLEIGQHELLMLLLVVCDPAPPCRRSPPPSWALSPRTAASSSLRTRPSTCLADTRITSARPSAGRSEAALRGRQILLPDGVVVRVEQHAL